MAKEIIVVFSHLPWDFPADYVKQTSLELGKRARVVVFNPLDFPTIRQAVFGGRKAAFLKRNGVVCFPSLGYFPFQRFEVIRKLNVYLNLLVFRIFYWLKFGRQRPIFWAFSHRLAELEDWLDWGKFLVYDRVDQVVSLDPKDDKRMRKQDRSLIKIADYVFVNSPYALRYVKKYNQASFLVPCGCNLSLFQKRKRRLPKQVKGIKKPIIGLIGSLDQRLDFETLYSLALKRKSWSFVFVGAPFSHDFAQFRLVNLTNWLKRLRKLPNVYFLGQKPKEQIPSFIASFDVCLIPYDTSQEFVKGCNPMKLYEYLAMGKPVVSTPIEAVEQYLPTVKVASDDIVFEKAVGKFVKSGYNKKKEEERKKIARGNSWEKKVEKMWEVVSSE